MGKTLMFLFVLGIAIGLGACRPEARSSRANASERQCLLGEFLVSNPEIPTSLIKIGQIELCGEGLQFTATWGPSYAKWSQAMQQEIEKLHQRLCDLGQKEYCKKGPDRS